MNSDLQGLIRLQELDLKIIQLQDRTKQIPYELHQFNQTLDSSRQLLEHSTKRTEDENKERRRLEGEVDLLRPRLSKYKGQLMEVKTNKEYQAVLHEIETVEREIRAKEDQILEKMVGVDDAERKAREAKKILEEEEKRVSGQRRELEQAAAQIDREIARLNEERSVVLQQVTRNLLQQYQRIASARRGVALAQAKDQSCQACHVKLRPQLFNDIKSNRFIITCESCNRILYYPGP